MTNIVTKYQGERLHDGTGRDNVHLKGWTEIRVFSNISRIYWKEGKLYSHITWWKPYVRCKNHMLCKT